MEGRSNLRTSFPDVEAKVRPQGDGRDEARPDVDLFWKSRADTTHCLQAKLDGRPNQLGKEERPGPSITIPLGYGAPHSAAQLFELSRTRPEFHDQADWETLMTHPASELSLGRYLVSSHSFVLDRVLHIHTLATERVLAAAQERCSYLDSDFKLSKVADARAQPFQKAANDANAEKEKKV